MKNIYQHDMPISSMTILNNTCKAIKQIDPGPTHFDPKYKSKKELVMSKRIIQHSKRYCRSRGIL